MLSVVSAKMELMPSMIKAIGSFETLSHLNMVLRQYFHCLGLVLVFKVIVSVLVLVLILVVTVVVHHWHKVFYT